MAQKAGFTLSQRRSSGATMAMPIGALSNAVRNRSCASARAEAVARSPVTLRLQIMPPTTRSPSRMGVTLIVEGLPVGHHVEGPSLAAQGSAVVGLHDHT